MKEFDEALRRAREPGKINKYTRKNADGTYRIPLEAAGSFRVEGGRFNAVFGDIVNELGFWESLGISHKEAIEMMELLKEDRR